MRLTDAESSYFQQCLADMKENALVQSMKKSIQHGCTSTYSHCEHVAYCSYRLANCLHLSVDSRSLIRGAFLHDFYLYDWHVKDPSHRLHGFRHPAFALNNACDHFELNNVEKNIIYSHMWPLTLSKIPKTREAIVVGIVDKLCSIQEIFNKCSQKSNGKLKQFSPLHAAMPEK